MFGPEPTGRVPGPQDAIELDDTFLSSDPLAYFESRIQGLITASARPASDLGEQYLRALGIRSEDLDVVDDDARALQVALDAFALRHHVAETLLRFVVAVIDARDAARGTDCVWYHASDSPIRLEDLLSRYRSISGRDDVMVVLLELLLPVELRPRATTDPRLNQAVGVMISWLDRALFLLQRQDINLNGIANKIKHGLVTRARDDLRVDLVKPSRAGEEPVLSASVLNGPDAIKIFDAHAVETLGRPASKEAFEHTVVMLRPAPLLAEAHMMARVHAAAFHVAAVAHLGSRDTYTPAPYPRLALGPEPDAVHRNAVVGSRRPVTFHSNGLPSTRKRGIADETHFVPLTVQGPPVEVTVTE